MDKVFNLAMALYAAALVAGVIGILNDRRALRAITVSLLGAGALAQTVYMALRWINAERAPFSNMFESLVLFAWTLVVVCLVVQVRVRLPLLRAASALGAVLTLAYASWKCDAQIRPLVPALQSNWLAVHVFTCFLAYGAFGVSFLAASGYLWGSYRGGSVRRDLQEGFEGVVTETISFGFLFLTVGIITGSVWANSAWGTYWSWDPKETWSLITWIVYAIFLHCRYARGWRGRRAAWISMAGFACVLFTYFGVSYLLSGLHSYGKP